MIINMDREPKYSLVFIGAEILKYLKECKEESIEAIHTRLRMLIDKNLHIDFLYYALDWLFILSLVDIEGDKVYYVNR